MYPFDEVTFLSILMLWKFDNVYLLRNSIFFSVCLCLCLSFFRGPSRDTKPTGFLCPESVTTLAISELEETLSSDLPWILLGLQVYVASQYWWMWERSNEDLGVVWKCWPGAWVQKTVPVAQMSIHLKRSLHRRDWSLIARGGGRIETGPLQHLLWEGADGPASLVGLACVTQQVPIKVC